jgi:hypothetical protein
MTFLAPTIITWLANEVVGASLARMKKILPLWIIFQDVLPLKQSPRRPFTGGG